MASINISRFFSVLEEHIDLIIVLLAFVNILLALTLSVFGSLMYPFFIIVYFWIGFYIIMIAMLIRRARNNDKHLIQSVKQLIIVAILTVLIRLIFIGMTHHISLDTLWYVDFGKFMHMGVVPYTGFYFPYPPVFGYFIYIITSVTQSVVGFRLFSIVMDVLVLLTLWKIVNQELGPRWASTAALAYAFLPISVIESGWNGHFEPLVVWLLLVSVWFLVKQKNSLSGIFLGLSIATKIYPIVVFPILFTYIKDWKNRLWFTLSVIISGLLTVLPILFLSSTTSPSGTTSTSESGTVESFFNSLFGFLFTISVFSAIVTIAIVLVITIGVVHLMRLISRNDPVINRKIYHSVTVALGIILGAMGIIAAFYPFLPIATEVYWRYPADVGFVRGSVTICIGALVIVNAYRDRAWVLKKYVSKNSLMALVGATTLLFVAMARQFFYGWYLLWSIPFFLILRDQRLSYTVILCLLLIYPNYTHDNFVGLGYDETRQWQDEFTGVDGWASTINIKGDFVNASHVSAAIDSDGTNGRLVFDTRNVTDNAFLENISISYTKVVEIDIDNAMEFVARIKSTWDPPFGRYADLSCTFEGIDEDNQSINGTIIAKTSVFTNLTNILWRHAFVNDGLKTQNGTITLLNFTIFPVQRVESYYEIDVLYTTRVSLLNPLSIIVIPTLMAIALISYAIMKNEFDIERRLASTSIDTQEDIKTESDH